MLHPLAQFDEVSGISSVMLASDDVFDWRSIEVVRSDGGWCELHLHRLARKLARRAGLGAFAVSLSHEERYATAVVLAERLRTPASGDGLLRSAVRRQGEASVRGKP